MSSEVASHKPVYLVLSGPGSGVAGAARISKEAGFSDAITFCDRSIHDLAGGIQRREISPVEIVEAYLRRIEALNGARGASSLLRMLTRRPPPSSAPGLYSAYNTGSVYNGYSREDMQTRWLHPQNRAMRRA